MTKHPTPTFAIPSENSMPLWLVTSEGLSALLDDMPESTRNWVNGTGFSGSPGAVVAIPGPDGEVSGAIGGLGAQNTVSRRRFVAGSVAAKLPGGSWRIESDLSPNDAEEAALGWLFSQYSFGRYKAATETRARLIAPDCVDSSRIEAIAAGECLTRDLINTPAADMGPNDLETECADLAKVHGATIKVIKGDDLLNENFPMIHTVGRANNREPRLIELNWGSVGPRVTLVGKGVCFDTGGLNLKPGSSMGLMKKDMGGAATVLGLAHMIMATETGVRLRVLIPAVENSVSANSFRPGDILTARNGMTVEINNTDAEGRLVLADALALAAEGEQDLLISMATLTGAARVAVGPDLSPYYTDDEAFNAGLQAAAEKVRDPVWRMPFWDPYEEMIEPGIADLDNAPSGGFAGSITAALFLRRFAGNERYAHFDIYGWNPKPAPARPKGGVGMGARAIFAALPDVLDL